MTQVNLSDYKNIYLQTAKEYVDKMSTSCTKLADNVLDGEALNNLHISSHSLKSQSQVMGFTDIASVSAMIEKNSKDILDGVVQIDDKFLVFLRDSINELNLKLTQIEKGDAEAV